MILDIIQKNICKKYKSGFFPPLENDKIGISKNVREGARPLNGLRIKPEGDTSGWYIWGGMEMLDDDDFFLPLHYSHIPSWEKLIMPYLALAPGWRFLITETYEDVWFDSDTFRSILR
ncbi:immunity protein Imm33 domain-containing protein [Asaia bogorensis]|uniref:immunity protein Imm33 domain-containing protein n=1 Tax=Asaia bogorensis TaxID=91915 RepID=UPI00285E2580|nr:hypothetical protein [Asaia bogorensis]MDR6182129.1 hypothetical protein [Asaia bogorensis NBRC 16594]